MVQTKSFLQRVLFGAFMGIICAVMAFCLSGCGQSDEELIKQGLDDELSVLSDPSDEELQDLIEKSGVTDDELSDFGIPSSDLIKSWIDGYSYEIGDITVDGDSAQAEVTMTIKHLGTILNDWSSTAIDALDITSYSSEEDLYADLGESMMKAINGAEPAAETATIDLEKSDDGWTLTDDGEEAIYALMLGEF